MLYYTWHVLLFVQLCHISVYVKQSAPSRNDAYRRRAAWCVVDPPKDIAAATNKYLIANARATHRHRAIHTPTERAFARVVVRAVVFVDTRRRYL